MPLDPATVTSTNAQINSNREEKAFTKLKADTKLLDELKTVTDCHNCHKRLNDIINRIENDLNNQLSSIITQIDSNFKILNSAIKSAVPVALDGGAAILLVLKTATSFMNPIAWNAGHSSVTVLPELSEASKLKQIAKGDDAKNKAQNQSGASLAGGSI